MKPLLTSKKNKPLKIACFFKFNLFETLISKEILRKYSVLFPSIADFDLITSLDIDVLLIEYSFFIENDISNFIASYKKTKTTQISLLIQEGVFINSEFLFCDFIDRIILLDKTKINLATVIDNTSKKHIKKEVTNDRFNHNWLNNEETKQKEKDIRVLQEINTAIDYNCEKGKISIATLVETLKTPHMYLVREINRITGLTAVTYILNYRLGIARTLLETTDYRVKDISNKLSFFNASYFTKRFKHLYGMSPTNYRKQAL